MQINPRQIILAACVSATLVCTGLTGCKTGDRSTGAYIDDRQTARHVRKELDHNGVYKFPDVKVSCYDSVVQLSGFVQTEQQKANAAAIAAHTPGVRQVLDETAIRQTPAMTPTGYPTGQMYAPAPVEKFHPTVTATTNVTTTVTTPNIQNNPNNPNPNQPQPQPQPQQQQQQ
jgi:hypothetical protein